MDTVSLVEALESGSHDGLLGVAEGQALDFKGAPYLVDSDNGKYELAKDVVAFANGDHDALIVIGVQTEKSPESRFEHAVALRHMRADLVDARRYAQILGSHCYPALRGVTVTFHARADDEERGLVAIRIPVQRDDERPFVVLAPVASDESKLQGWLIGLPTRALDETEQMSAAQLHELIRGGRFVTDRLDQILGILSEQRHLVPRVEEPSATEPAEPVEEPTPSVSQTARSVIARVTKRCASVVEQFARDPDGGGGTFRTPALWIGAGPTGATSVPTIFRKEGVRAVLERPPMTRHDGWGLLTGAQAEIIDGERRVLASSRLRVEYYEDGTLIAVARADRLLAVTPDHIWGDPGATRPLKVNPLAVIEFIFNFVSTYSTLLDYTDPRVERTAFVIGVDAITGSPRGDLYLPPYGLGTAAWNYADTESYPPPDRPDFSGTVEADVNDGTVPVVALRLVERLYPYFKRQLDEIPYLTEERDAVNPASFGG